MISSRHLLAFTLALLATASLAALPSAAAGTSADAVEDRPSAPPCEVRDADDVQRDVQCLPDQICEFTPYPEAGYPECVRRTIGSP